MTSRHQSFQLGAIVLPAIDQELQTVTAARFVEERVSDKPQQVVVVGDLDADPEAASVRF